MKLSSPGLRSLAVGAAPIARVTNRVIARAITLIEETRPHTGCARGRGAVAQGLIVGKRLGIAAAYAGKSAHHVRTLRDGCGAGFCRICYSKPRGLSRLCGQVGVDPLTRVALEIR